MVSGTLRVDVPEETKSVLSRLSDFDFEGFKFVTQISGSTARGTRTSTSDTDINVTLCLPPITNQHTFPEHVPIFDQLNPKYVVPAESQIPINFTDHKHKITSFKSALYTYLKNFDEYVVRWGSVAIWLKYNAEEYDIVPCVPYHILSGGGEVVYEIDMIVVGSDPATVRVGGTDLLIEDTRQRNRETFGQYADLIKFLKKLNSSAKAKIPSGLLEAICLQIPTEVWRQAVEINRALALLKISIYIYEILIPNYENLFFFKDILYVKSRVKVESLEAFAQTLLSKALKSKL